MSKIVVVRAFFGKEMRRKKIHVPTGRQIKRFGLPFLTYPETEENFEYVPVNEEISDCKVDMDRLAFDLGVAVEELAKEGYEVIQITPIISGRHNHEVKEYTTASVFSLKGKVAKLKEGWGWAYGYGFSYTDGLLILAQKRSSTMASKDNEF